MPHHIIQMQLHSQPGCETETRFKETGTPHSPTLSAQTGDPEQVKHRIICACLAVERADLDKHNNVAFVVTHRLFTPVLINNITVHTSHTTTRRSCYLSGHKATRWRRKHGDGQH